MWQFSRMVMTGKIQVDGSRQVVSMASDLFADLLRSSIAPAFDEKWYLEKYPDVASAMRGGTVTTALDHYIAHGFYENRLPYAVRVDERYYIDAYPDVKTALDSAIIRSAQEHFEDSGFREGRLPGEGWKLFDGPVAIDFRAGVDPVDRDGQDGVRRRKSAHERI